MAKKTKDLTLDTIGKLLDKKLAINNAGLAKMMDDKLSRNNVVIFGAIDSSAERVEKEIKKLGKEMNERFDVVGDQLQEVLQAATEITDQKLKEFKQKYLSA